MGDGKNGYIENPGRIKMTEIRDNSEWRPEVNHPKHYTSHPSGVECITITEWMNFNLGNAVKYIWRLENKGDQIINLQKAKWYLEREISRLARSSGEKQ